MNVFSKDVFTSFAILQDKNELFQDPKGKKKSVGGRHFRSIWLHFEKREAVASGKYGAKCKYCSAIWRRGETPVLEEHLANYCSNAPALVLREYIAKIIKQENISIKK